MVAANPSINVRAGDPPDQAIPRLMELHGGKLYALSLRFCGNTHQAEDLVQDTFLQAFRKWHTFKGDADPGTWLYTIAARRCKRLHRRKVGEPKHVASLDVQLPATGKVPDLPSNIGTPLDEQLRAEAIEQVERAIVKLPIAFRMPLVLKDIAGFSVDDVAQITGMKEPTVKTRLHRARLMVRSLMSKKLPQKDAPPPAYTKQVCMDLLAAKQEALDRGAPFPLPQEDFCQRCAAVFASMDLAADACQRIGQGELPAKLKAALRERLAS